MGDNMQLYERAKSMILADKFGLLSSDFGERLGKLLADYIIYDSVVVETEQGASDNMLITVSVKKIRPLGRPQK